MKEIQADDAYDAVQESNAALVCAYKEEEKFEENRLDEAFSLDEFRNAIGSIDLDRQIIFYCACPNEETARERAREFELQGFTNVYVLLGGVEAWRTAGYELTAV
jgi:rhodanese-related sulfurtransferase